MLENMLNQSGWALVFEAALVSGIVTKLIGIFHEGRLIKESEQLDRPKTPWMKALKKRFDGYAQLDFHVEDPVIFVDKYMEMDRICGLKSRAFYQIPILVAGVILLAALQGTEVWLFGAGLNVCMVFLMLELLFRGGRGEHTIRTNLLLAVEKNRIREKRGTVPKRERPKARAYEEAAAERESLLSQEELEVFGNIIKEWWEFE